MIRAARLLLTIPALALACSKAPAPEEARVRAAPAGEPAATPAADHGKVFTADRKQPPPPGGERDLGIEFRDPSWFNARLFDGAQVVKQSRSERDADGFFTSLYLFQLPEGTTTKQCADRLREVLADHVPSLTEAPDGPDRVKLTGSAEYYEVVLMCGPGREGKSSAFVSYRWTARPPSR